MDKMTAAELLEIIVSLDNEAARDPARAAVLRGLKWKVFSAMTELDKRGGS